MPNKECQKVVKTPWPSLMGLWSLLWRATLLAPLAVLVMILWLMAWMGLIVLPFLSVYFLWLGAWLMTLATFCVWVITCLLVRLPWFRVGREDCLNEQENV